MSRALYTALAIIVLASAGALLISTRVWQTVDMGRPQPLPPAVVDVTGRTLSGVSTALALVALAGAAAAFAARGTARQVVGAIVALAGAGLVWDAATGFGEVSSSRAAALLEAAHQGALDGTLTITTQPAWPAVSLACGIAIALAGAVVAWRGAAWAGMSRRYEAPAAGTSSAWDELDAGTDPTA